MDTSSLTEVREDWGESDAIHSARCAVGPFPTLGRLCVSYLHES
jgi:hypothetical protein